MGISVEEYEARWNAILKKFGTSLDAPTGWNATELFFSCKKPPIIVPVGGCISAEQRETTIRRAEKQFGA